MGRFYAIFEFFVIKSLFMDRFGCFFREINLEFYFLWLSLAPSIIGAGLMLFLKFFGINLKFFRYLKIPSAKVLSTGVFETKLHRCRFYAIFDFFE